MNSSIPAMGLELLSSLFKRFFSMMSVKETGVAGKPGLWVLSGK